MTQCQILEQTSQMHHCKSLKSHIVCAISVLAFGLACTITNTNKSAFIHDTVADYHPTDKTPSASLPCTFS